MTGVEFELYLYKLINSHEIPSIKKTLAEEIRGQVYYSGKRPDNSNEEDIVISFVAGIDGTPSVGVIMVNVFVPDKEGSNGQPLSRDLARIMNLSQLIKEFRDTVPVGDIWLDRDTTIQDYPVTPLGVVKQHYINLQIKLYYNGTIND